MKNSQRFSTKWNPKSFLKKRKKYKTSKSGRKRRKCLTCSDMDWKKMRHKTWTRFNHNNIGGAEQKLGQHAIKRATQRRISRHEVRLFGLLRSRLAHVCRLFAGSYRLNFTERQPRYQLGFHAIKLYLYLATYESSAQYVIDLRRRKTFPGYARMDIIFMFQTKFI